MLLRLIILFQRLYSLDGLYMYSHQSDIKPYVASKYRYFKVFDRYMKNNLQLWTVCCNWRNKCPWDLSPASRLFRLMCDQHSNVDRVTSLAPKCPKWFAVFIVKYQEIVLTWSKRFVIIVASDQTTSSHYRPVRQ